MDTSIVLTLLNQLFEIQKKIRNTSLEKSLQRNLNRIQECLQEAGYRLHDPTGEAYDLSRLDCEAMVSGEGTGQLVIVEVIKPIVYQIEESRAALLQKGVVIVEQQ